MHQPKPAVESIGVTVSDVPHAPFIYFEAAPALGHVNGLIRITLSAERSTLNNGHIVSEHVAVGYLRTNVQGAQDLITALNSALLLAKPAENSEGPTN